MGDCVLRYIGGWVRLDMDCRSGSWPDLKKSVRCAVVLDTRVSVSTATQQFTRAVLHLGILKRLRTRAEFYMQLISTCMHAERAYKYIRWIMHVHCLSDIVITVRASMRARSVFFGH
jgi:hypothetical protein